MTDIIKTWPSFMPRAQVREVFTAGWGLFYFTLGRGKPKQEIERLWFTHKGRILGSFKINRIVQNDGTLPRLQRLDGGESEWQIKPDRWVAICLPPFARLKETVYHESFRGFRYFNLEQYRGTADARINLEAS
jgi:hypothetical protein